MSITKDRIKEIILQETTSLKESDLQNADQSFHDMGIDSLEQSSIFLSVEEEFGVEVSDEDLEDVQTINQLQEYVNSRL